MPRLSLIAALATLAVGLAPGTSRAQSADWTPPSRTMPMMPRVSELSGDWLSSRAEWFRGLDLVSGVATGRLKATGEPRGGNAYAQIARFADGPVPVVVWSDRNGDTRCDMIEVFKSGGIIIQLIDADFDGQANVVRVYDSEGKLLRQNPL